MYLLCNITDTWDAVERSAKYESHFYHWRSGLKFPLEDTFIDLILVYCSHTIIKPSNAIWHSMILKWWPEINRLNYSLQAAKVIYKLEFG